MLINGGRHIVIVAGLLLVPGDGSNSWCKTLHALLDGDGSGDKLGGVLCLYWQRFLAKLTVYSTSTVCFVLDLQ